jgi:hypothetical protein
LFSFFNVFFLQCHLCSLVYIFSVSSKTFSNSNRGAFNIWVSWWAEKMIGRKNFKRKKISFLFSVQFTCLCYFQLFWHLLFFGPVFSVNCF